MKTNNQQEKFDLMMLLPAEYDEEQITLPITFRNANFYRPDPDLSPDTLELIGLEKGRTLVLNGNYGEYTFPIYFTGDVLTSFIEDHGIKSVNTTKEITLELNYELFIDYSDNNFFEPLKSEMIFLKCINIEDNLRYFSDSFNCDDNEKP